MAPPRAVLIDGSGLLYRAFHGLPATLCTQAGEPTNAIFGFATMFRRILRGRTPRFGAVVFDAPGPTFRHALDPLYKAHRPPMPEALRAQLAGVEGLVQAHGFRALRVPGVEADDVIATLARQARDAGMELTLVSGDKDLAQLVVDERVRLLDGVDELFVDPDRVRRTWGVRPQQIPDWLALVGDRADGIPGVPGIGREAAAVLLGQHEDLETLLDQAEALGGKHGDALRRHADRARLSKRLATLREDLDLPMNLEELTVQPPGPEGLNAAYRRWELFSLLSAEVPEAPPAYFVCDTPETVAAALAHEAQGPEPVGLYLLIEAEGPRRGDLTGLALSPQPHRAVYLPLRGEGALGPDGLELVRSWLEDPDRPKVLHDAKAAMVALRQRGVRLRGVVGDTALASYLLDPTRHLPHRIEQVARSVLHRGLQPVRGVVGSGRERARFDALSLHRAGAWACHLADATGACWPLLLARLREEGLEPILRGTDLPLAEVLVGMELHGLQVDPTVLRDLGARFEAERAEAADEVHRLAGRAFNVGSPKQLGTVLFEELGLPIQARTRTGYATTAAVLDALRPLHPIADAVLRWRTADKLLNTYTEVLVRSVDPDTGRIHTTFQQTSSASGRLLTTDPDLQRTPVRTETFREVRRAFVAPPGRVLLSADWSQVELRLLAHMSQDPALLAACRAGADLHTGTAAALFDLAPTAVQPAQRAIGKSVNFATLYGQGAPALAQQLGIPHRQAKAYIDAFFERFAGVAAWKEATVAQARRDGFVTTLGGRRRQIPELATGNRSDQAYGERIATNTPIQGSAADLCKAAMLAIDGVLRDEKLDAVLVLQIHDELLFEVAEPAVQPAAQAIRHGMETVWALDVPLVATVGVGPTWADAH